MPAFTMTKNWDDGFALDESMLDDIKDSVETFLNVTKIDSDNIQTGGVNAAALASNSVTTAKITDGNVTAAKMAADSVTSTAMADGAVSKIHMATFEGSVGTGAIAFTTTSTSATAVTGYSVTGFVSTGRPIRIECVNLNTLLASISVSRSSGTGQSAATFELRRDGVAVAKSYICTGGAASTGDRVLNLPLSSLTFTERGVAAGTYAYALYVSTDTSTTTVALANGTLAVYELA